MAISFIPGHTIDMSVFIEHGFMSPYKYMYNKNEEITTKSTYFSSASWDWYFLGTSEIMMASSYI